MCVIFDPPEQSSAQDDVHAPLEAVGLLEHPRKILALNLVQHAEPLGALSALATRRGRAHDRRAPWALEHQRHLPKNISDTEHT